MNYGGYFDPDRKKARISDLEKQMAEPSFWNDKRKSEMIINECNGLKDQLQLVETTKKSIEEHQAILELLKEDPEEETQQLVELQLPQLWKQLEEAEIQILLNGPYDALDAIVEVHSGAGGTEACDWANMIARMIQRWSERKNYKVEILEVQEGEEAGIKGMTMLIKGNLAYGYLKEEKGVHRLVRISPFDSNARRHTSFASIDVTPWFEMADVDIEIKDTDLRIDVYRSSGCGGQGVNTTDSAVRITHLPTKIVVTCQNERSQIQNKERAMEVLKSKLYQLEIEKRNQEMQKLKGGVMDVNFGSQIRSYVMHPYSMVKDHRTNIETSNVEKVLDGDLDLFIHASLKKE